MERCECETSDAYCAVSKLYFMHTYWKWSESSKAAQSERIKQINEFLLPISNIRLDKYTHAHAHTRTDSKSELHGFYHLAENRTCFCEVVEISLSVSVVPSFFVKWIELQY